jgi:hypothetical protein
VKVGEHARGGQRVEDGDGVRRKAVRDAKAEEHTVAQRPPECGLGDEDREPAEHRHDARQQPGALPRQPCRRCLQREREAGRGEQREQGAVAIPGEPQREAEDREKRDEGILRGAAASPPQRRAEQTEPHEHERHDRVRSPELRALPLLRDPHRDRAHGRAVHGDRQEHVAPRRQEQRRRRGEKDEAHALPAPLRRRELSGEATREHRRGDDGAGVHVRPDEGEQRGVQRAAPAPAKLARHQQHGQREEDRRPRLWARRRRATLVHDGEREHRGEGPAELRAERQRGCAEDADRERRHERLGDDDGGDSAGAVRERIGDVGEPGHAVPGQALRRERERILARDAPVLEHPSPRRKMPGLVEIPHLDEEGGSKEQRHRRQGPRDPPRGRAPR